jgi:hypothetical protein
VPTPDDLERFEGHNIPQTEYDALSEHLEWLTDEHRARLDGWAAEAHAANVSISVRQRPSVRRAEILRAAIKLAQIDDPVPYLDGCEAPPGETVGARLGLLTVAQARHIQRNARTVSVVQS